MPDSHFHDTYGGTWQPSTRLQCDDDLSCRMKITTVLLDVDGTLRDSNDAHTQAWQRALAGVGHNVPYGELRALIGKGGDKLLKEVVGIDDE